MSLAPEPNAFQAEGDEQELTVDLGETQKVGGGRVDCYCMWGGVRFPRAVEIRTSTDGAKFRTRGRDRYRSARFAHNGWPADWPLHPRHNAPASGSFPDFGLKANYIFVPFEKPVQARYVRFIVQAQPGHGFQLTEVNVWDRLEERPWTPRLAHDPRTF